MEPTQKLRIDLRDIYLLHKFRWYKQKGPRPYIFTSVKQRTVYLHRLITNAPQGMDVDHIDGNPLNNSRNNLRLCNRSQNLIARLRIHNTSTSGFRGVSLVKRTGRYTAQIDIGGKKFHLGTYATAEEAAIAYNKKALEVFGEFARPNAGVS